jgi:hypothetical protein
MPKIVDRAAYDGFDEKVRRLGLTDLIKEVTELVSDFELNLKEEKHANGAAFIRKTLDDRFSARDGWRITKSGGIDWIKSLQHGAASVCAGVELQISARSDLLTNDLTHLMQAIELGRIDIGVIVVPSDATAYYLTDRCPRFSYAQDHVTRAKAQFSPILLLSIGHDGPGPALPKQITNLGQGKS